MAGGETADADSSVSVARSLAPAPMQGVFSPAAACEERLQRRGGLSWPAIPCCDNCP